MSNVDSNCPACHRPLGSTVNCRNCVNFKAAIDAKKSSILTRVHMNPRPRKRLPR